MLSTIDLGLGKHRSVDRRGRIEEQPPTLSGIHTQRLDALLRFPSRR